jgi:TolB protein
VRGLWRHDLATGAETPVAVGGLSATSPAFSPDGTLLAFEGRAPGAASADLYVVPAAGGEPLRLTDDPHEDVGPAWAPDGASLYFVSTRTGAYEVFRVAAAGGQATQVTNRPRIVGKPAATPDGAALVYARTVGGGSATEVVRLDLATSQVGVTSSQDDSEPAASPDGSRLAIRSFRHGQAEILLVDPLDGGRPFRLTQDPASDGAVAFAPPPPATTRGGSP